MASQCGVCRKRGWPGDLREPRGETQPSGEALRNLGEALKDEQAQRVGRVGSVPRSSGLEPVRDGQGWAV